MFDEAPQRSTCHWNYLRGEPSIYKQGKPSVQLLVTTMDPKFQVLTFSPRLLWLQSQGLPGKSSQSLIDHPDPNLFAIHRR